MATQGLFLKQSPEKRFLTVDPDLSNRLNLLLPVFQSDLSVCLMGETGCGKTILASDIHAQSLRNGRVFVKVDCTSLKDSLSGSQLFGHRKGAFTGADDDYQGFFKEGHGGTVFLDEIAEVPLLLQPELLRVLDERKFRPVGGKTDVVVDVRFIAATLHNLEERVAAGKFRRDLFYRLMQESVTIPPLRARPLDIRMIVSKFFEQRETTTEQKLTPAAHDKLLRHEWPGNVRELLNVLEGAWIRRPGATIDADDIRLLRPIASGTTLENCEPSRVGDLVDVRIGDTLAESEKRLCTWTVAVNGGSISKAARMLGIADRTLRRKLEQWDESPHEE